jgi:hypothetical protein
MNASGRQRKSRFRQLFAAEERNAAAVARHEGLHGAWMASADSGGAVAWNSIGWPPLFATTTAWSDDASRSLSASSSLLLPSLTRSTWLAREASSRSNTVSSPTQVSRGERQGTDQPAPAGATCSALTARTAQLPEDSFVAWARNAPSPENAALNAGAPLASTSRLGDVLSSKRTISTSVASSTASQ